MKKILTNFPALLLFLFAQFLVVNTAYSQGVLGTDDDGFVIQITSPASIAQTIVHGADPGVCQWIGQSECLGVQI